MDSKSKIGGAAAVLLSLRAVGECTKGALIATRIGTDAVVGTELLHTLPIAVHAVEFGAETSAIGKARRPFDDIGVAARSANGATATSIDGASRDPPWVHQTHQVMDVIENAHRTMDVIDIIKKMEESNRLRNDDYKQRHG